MGVKIAVGATAFSTAVYMVERAVKEGESTFDVINL